MNEKLSTVWRSIVGVVAVERPRSLSDMAGWLLVLIGFACFAQTATAQTFQWPVNDPNSAVITQQHACRQCLSPGDVSQQGRYAHGINMHSGVDIIPGDGNLTVRAPAAGTVEQVVPMGSNPNSPTNHGLGNVVIIHHPADGVYTMYAHLASMSVSTGQPVSAGDAIGVMGNTGGDFGIHLHFEVKTTPTLENQSDVTSDHYWGYTPGHPDLYNTFDPLYFVDPTYVIETISPTVMVNATGGSVNIRNTPGLTYWSAATEVIGNLGADQKVVAWRRCSVGGVDWYFVHLPSRNEPFDSDHPNNGPHAGWVSSTVLSIADTQSHIEVLGTYNVRSEPSSAGGVATIVARVYAGQRFVTFGQPSPGTGCSEGWHQIHLSGSNTTNGWPGNPPTTGWICGAGIEFIGDDAPTIALSPTSLVQTSNPGQSAASQTFEVWNAGEGVLEYSISTDAAWLSVSPASGTHSGGVGAANSHTVIYSNASLPPGEYSASITIDSPNATNSPQTIPVSLTVLMTPCEPYWDNTIAQTSNTDGVTYALTEFDDGSGPWLYAGGTFSTIGGTQANRIGKWDGGEWLSLFEEVEGHSVRAFTVWNGDLIVGGRFSQAGGHVVNNIARWDGNAWHPLGSGTSGGTNNGQVTALAVHEGFLVAGGSFTTAGDVAANRIAKWDGNSWSPLGSGMNNAVYAVTAIDHDSGSVLYAGGVFTNAGGTTANRVAKWDGVQWSTLGTGVWASSNPNVQALEGFDDGSGPALFAGGNFTSAGGVSAIGIAKWDGAQWHEVGGGLTGTYPGYFGHGIPYALLARSEASVKALYAAGNFRFAGGHEVHKIARWDGHEWSPLGEGIGGHNSTAYALASLNSDESSTVLVGGTNGSPNWAGFVRARQGCQLLYVDPSPSQPPPYNPPAPPEPEQNNLILVTHGWNTNQSTFNGFWTTFANLLDVNTGDDWQVHLYDWTADSGSASLQFGPDYALGMGISHGYGLGMEIGQQGYDHVHLIAHSAGSALISAAAYYIKQFSPGTTVHTTYLDAFAGSFIIGGVGNYEQAYGGNSDWSDHYYSRELGLGWDPFCGATTGSFTELYLPQSFNVDVTLVDPAYTPMCLSSHSWPYWFYQNSVFGDYGVYGWPLSFAEAEPGTDVAAWLAQMHSTFPKGSSFALSPTAGGGAGGDNLVFRKRHDDPIDLATVPSFTSPEGDVLIDSDFVAVLSEPEGHAWVNFKIAVDQSVNFIAFDLEFTSDPKGQGLMTLFVNGKKRGVVDEVYAPAGLNAFALPTPGELEPGIEHVVSFRLDNFGGTPSSIAVADVATGWGGFVNIADLNMDGVVDVSDLLMLLGAWGPCPRSGDCPADLNGDGAVDVSDLLMLLANWG